MAKQLPPSQRSIRRGAGMSERSKDRVTPPESLSQRRPIHQNEIAFVPLPLRPPLHFAERQSNAVLSASPDTTAVTPPSAPTWESMAPPKEPPYRFRAQDDGEVPRMMPHPPGYVGYPNLELREPPAPAFRVEPHSGAPFSSGAEPRPTIVLAVLRNRAEIDLLAASFLALIGIMLMIRWPARGKDWRAISHMLEVGFNVRAAGSRIAARTRYTVPTAGATTT
jgi:hypothetical protein